MKKGMSLFLLVTLLLTTTFLMGGSGKAFGEDEIPKMNLRFATYFGPNVTSTKVFMKFEEYVKEMTDGKVTFTNYIGGALLDVTNTMHGVRDGIADMAFDVIFDRAAQPLLNTCGRATLNVSSDIMAPVYAMRDMLKEYPAIMEEFKRNNVYPVFFTCAEAQILFSKRPIKTLDDLKGLKVRAAESTAFALNKLGANTASIPAGEVYEAIQRGTLEATIPPFNLGAALKQHEVAPYITDLGWGVVNTMPYLINLNKWNSFPQKLQEIFLEAGRRAEEDTVELTNENNRKLIESFMAEGGKAVPLSEADMAKFKEITQPETNNRTVQEAVKAGHPEAEEIQKVFAEKIKQYEGKSPVKYKDPFYWILEMQK